MNQQVNPVQQNAIGRAMLLQNGISMVKRLQPASGAWGGSIRVPLLRMGIMTGVLLQITAPVTLASAVKSALSPYNVVKTVTYTDFAGVNRTKTTGWQLWAAQCFKQGDLTGVIGAQTSGQTYDYDTDITNVPTADGDGQVTFSLYVPMAYDPANDLTGAVLTQTNVGEHFITLDLASGPSGADPYSFPYTAGATANGAVSVQAFQYYIQPADMNAANLPILDLSTIYGFEGGFQTTANINAGQSTYINMPNNRAILSSLVQFQEGGIFTDGNLDGITMLANSNTNFREMTPRMLRETMRNMVNADMPKGNYFVSTRRQPILTQLYANVQLKFDVTRANAGITQFSSQYEVQYPSGAPLPGITVAA